MCPYEKSLEIYLMILVLIKLPMLKNGKLPMLKKSGNVFNNPRINVLI